MANSCTNEGICHRCGIAGHQAKVCTARQLPHGDLRLATTVISKATLQLKYIVRLNIFIREDRK
ncbi:unnamed protein product [Arabidopsis halleri]